VSGLMYTSQEQIAWRRWEMCGGHDLPREHAVGDWVAAERVLHKVISEAAYFHWINRGQPFSDPLTDWLVAEIEILSSLAVLDQPSGTVIDEWLRDLSISNLSISNTAYFRWENRGRPFDDPLADWLAAQDEVLAEVVTFG
jgi:hypothetical protein